MVGLKKGGLSQLNSDYNEQESIIRLYHFSSSKKNKQKNKKHPTYLLEHANWLKKLLSDYQS